MTQLRRQMLDELERRNYSANTVKGGVNVDRFGGAKIDQLAGIQRFAWDGWNGA